MSYYMKTGPGDHSQVKVSDLPFSWTKPGRCKGENDEGYPIFHHVTIYWWEEERSEDMTEQEFQRLLKRYGVRL